MISRLFISILALFPLLSVAETTDLLRFDNGDQLHGQFQGFGEESSVLWKRNPPEGEAIPFQSPDIRQVILKSGKPDESIGSLAYVGTSNGDRIPGVVQELDDKRVLVQTDFAGLLEFPRDQVGIIAPNPMGGRVLYHGPFDKTEWIQKNLKHPIGIPMDKNEVEIEKEFPLWKFSGSAWYWKDARSGTALTRETGMTDRSILQFDIAWKNRLSVTVGFHADFKVPANAKPQQEQLQNPRNNNIADLPYLFGSSYVLHIYSNYVVLYRSGFNEEGTAIMERLQSKNSTLRLSNSGSAKCEIRCNRITGDILLFVDDQFVSEWNEKPVAPADQENPNEGYVGKGAGYGFMVQMEDSPLRASDIIVAEWNGIPDSARSLISDDTDIVLLNNGTDRFSGKITNMKDGKVNLTGRFGNFSFPLTEIAEIRFAKSQLKAFDEAAPPEFKVRFHPLGTISGQIVSGDAKNIRLLNTAAGEINIELNSASMLEFKSIQNYLDDWNVEF
ncbi:MAG: hypothetical protein V4727_10250 [Verrucomicrobiota bacterium]